MINQVPMDQRIDQYLAGELSPEDLLAFEKELAMNGDLKESLGLEIATRTGTFAAGIQDHKKELHTRFYEQRPEETKIITSTRRILYIGAIAAAIALLVSFFVFVPRTPASGQELFAANYERPLASVMRGADGFEAYKAAQIAYAAGDFSSAVIHYETALQNAVFPAKDEARFYLAIAQMELDQNKVAANNFKQLSNSTEYAQMAAWYDALSSLKSGLIDDAKTKLVSITQSQG
ncbi:MAG: tol-pal system YbgF family protein, partial [Bacteroidia bacterium]